MNLEKAIEVLEAELETNLWFGKSNLTDAMRLGIDVLKRHKQLMNIVPYCERKLLPGETED